MKTIIFDFDGTIADTLPVITKIYYEMFPNKAVMDKAALERLRLLPAQKIAKELGISGWKLPFMLRKGRKLMRMRMHEAELFEGMANIIQELHTRGYQLEVVSSNST